MGKRKGGSRRKSRQALRKHVRERGKISISQYFAKYSIGDRVVLKANPAIHKGLYDARFHGRSGKIIGKRGACYKISVVEGNKTKTLIVHPVHLTKQ